MNKIVYNHWVFGPGEIQTGNVYKTRSLSNSVLEIDTLNVEVRSEDETLRDFTKYDPLYYYYDEKLIGTYYVENIRRIAKNAYAISAVSIMGILDVTEHYGGIYDGSYARDVVQDICAGIPVKVRSNMEMIQLYGHLSIASRRSNLSQVLLAMGAHAKADNNGILRIEPLWTDVSFVLTEDDVFLDGNVDYGVPAKSAIVTEHQYLRGTERRTIFEEATESAEMIKFDSPHHDLIATGITILESNANYARVSRGNGTITGIPYIHNTKAVTVGSYTTDETAVRVSGATLISNVNSYNVAERVLYFAQRAERAHSDIVYTTQNAGDIIQAPNAYSETQNSCIQSLSITMSSSLSRARQVSLIDFVPPEPDHIPADVPAVSAFVTTDGNYLRDKDKRNFLA